MARRGATAKAARSAAQAQGGQLTALSSVAAEKATVPAVAPQFVGLGSQFTSPRRGVRELLKLYKDAPWLRAIVGKIARHVADTDWFMVAAKDENGKYRIDSEVRKAVRTGTINKLISVGRADRIENHPLLTMLRDGTGNPRLNGHGCLAVTMQHLDLAGESFWLWERNQLGVPYAFWPLPPNWVTDMPSREKPFYHVAAPGGLQIDIPVTEICPFIDPDPENPYTRGVGTAQSLDDEIQIDEFAAKHQKSFFLNRARPDIIISGQFLSQKDSERLEKQWMSDHQGFWKAFKPLFFSQKIDVKELTQTFEQMQMVQMRKAERDTFISVFGAPPEKFGIIGESKRSTIQAADYFWTKDIIQPRVEMLRRVLQQVAVPMFDTRLVLAYETPVIQDDELKLETMKAAPWAYTINQWQEAAGNTSMGERGEFFAIPLNMVLIPAKDLKDFVPHTTEENDEAAQAIADQAAEDEAETPQEEMMRIQRMALRARGKAQGDELDVTSLAQAIASAVTSAMSQPLADIKRRITFRDASVDAFRDGSPGNGNGP